MPAELAVLIAVMVVGMVIYTKPANLPWSCVFGKHTFHRHGVKHGMYQDNKTNQVVGTTRQLYQCSCGKWKKAEDADWLNGIK